MRANPRPGPQRNAPWVAKTDSPHSSQGRHYPMGAPWVVVLELVLAPVEVQSTPRTPT